MRVFFPLFIGSILLQKSARLFILFEEMGENKMGATQLYTKLILYDHKKSFERTDDYVLHCHSLYEIYYFISGDVSYLVEGRRYCLAPNSILLLPANVFHGFRVESERPYERYTLHFYDEVIPVENRFTLLSPFQTSGDRMDIYYPDTQKFQMGMYFENLISCSRLPADMRDMAASVFIQALLVQILYMSRTTKNIPSGGQSGQAALDMIRYLNEHIGEDITLGQLSSRFFISRHYINRVFRRATGTTVMQYVIHKRLALAQQLILQGKPSAQAAAESGFGDYSVFYRAYRKIFGHSPAEDKRKT